MILLSLPMLAFVVFVKILQQRYSVIPPMRLIYGNSLLDYPSIVPVLLLHDSWLVIVIASISIVFLALSNLDLIYYYASMNFP